MPSLLELQERFGAMLESDDAAAGHGFDVYRHAIGANYRRAFAATYPVVRELLGPADFDDAVDAFVATHPPVSGDLNVYGDAFPDFLERRVAPRDGVRDMARLEWAIDESARAADISTSPADVIAALATKTEDAIASARLTLHPSCALLEVPRVTFDAWLAQQTGRALPTTRTARGEWDLLLIRREGQATTAERIGAGEFAWLNALQAGETLDPALERALDCDSSFDLERALHRRVHDGTIVHVIPQ